MRRGTATVGGDALVAAALEQSKESSDATCRGNTTTRGNHRQATLHHCVGGKESALIKKEVHGSLPEEMVSLLYLLEGLESVIALKRGNRAQFIHYRGDKQGIEAAAKRNLKIQHFQQLKALLGDAAELKWVVPRVQQQPRGAQGIRDLDLGIRFSVPQSPTPLAASAPSPVALVSAGLRTPRSQPSSPTRTPEKVKPVAPSANTPPQSPSRLECSRLASAARTRLLGALARHVDPHWSIAHTTVEQLAAVVTRSKPGSGASLGLPLAPLPERPSSVPRHLSHSRSQTPASRCANSPCQVATPCTSLRRGRQLSGPLLASGGSGSCGIDCSVALAQFASPSPSPASRFAEPLQPAYYTPVASNANATASSSAKQRRSASADAVPGGHDRAGAHSPYSTERGTARRLNFDTGDAETDIPLSSKVDDCPVQGRSMRLPLPAKASLFPQMPLERAPAAVPFQTPSKRPRSQEAAYGDAVYISPTATSRTPKTPKVATPARVATPEAQMLPNRARQMQTPSSTPSRSSKLLLGSPLPSSASSSIFYTMRPPGCATARAGLFSSRLPHTTTVAATPRKLTSSQSAPSTPAVHLGPQEVLGSSSSVTKKPSHTLARPTVAPRCRRMIRFDETAQCTPNGSGMSADVHSMGDKSQPPARLPVVRSPFARPRRSELSLASKGAEAELIEIQNSEPRLATQAESLSALETSSFSCDAGLVAASIMDDSMFATMARNKERAAADREATDEKVLAEAVVKAARPRLPALFSQLRAVFEQRRSLVMPFSEAVTAVLGMGLAPEGMTRADAVLYLHTLADSAPEWLALLPARESPNRVQVARMCTGIWERLVREAS